MPSAWWHLPRMGSVFQALSNQAIWDYYQQVMPSHLDSAQARFPYLAATSRVMARDPQHLESGQDW